MEFKAHFKRKRKSFHNFNKLAAFPSCEYKGIFNGLAVEVVNTEQASIASLHDNGGYGKGSMSRGGPNSGNPQETLLLGLEEACLLAYFLDALEISDLTGSKLSWTEFLQVALEYDTQFVYKLAAYLYLKAKNWIIKSGIKFGGDFLIYKQGPSHFHASFLVIVQNPCNDNSSHFVAKNLKGVQRVAETSDKDVLLLNVKQTQEFNPLLVTRETLSALTIEETVIRRFNYTSFVQSKQKQ
ncbi:tRNA-splicing endonuclease subunit Sen2 [Drosophila sulfurigaster albostrigata]|uniref:tRNA-splicing endonuclease subunit Sen2 n=1 Tax=Drosophila sulfurigaster albostrigata TaxID=89887 RepID=UPI002D21EAC9|nr:tRNA-splicing endonuclease subunit Sen2 [Drosophila sulfurigaster albostrigata]